MKYLAPKQIVGKDGEAYTLRPIKPDDAPSVVRGYAAMSDRAKWFRMLHAVAALNTKFVRTICNPDPETEVCLVVEGRDALSRDVIAGARVSGLALGGAAEYSVSARPEGEGLGLARQALEAVIDVARERSCATVWGLVARENAAMRALAAKLGFKETPCAEDPGLVETRLHLTQGTTST